jgi:hypothetical protein
MRTAFRTMKGVKQRRSSPAHWPRLWASFGALVIIAMGCDAGAPLLRGSSGVTEGDPFPLDAGTHVVAWTASPQTMEGCDLEIHLVDDEENVVGTVQESFDSGGARQDVTPVMELSEGTYRLRTATTCEQWTARVARE